MVDLEVNITSYNYPGMVNSLARQIRDKLPNVFIRVWDNSPDKQEFKFVDEVRWNRFNPSLTRVWNWAIGQSDTPWVWITNDDIKLHEGWYDAIYAEMIANPSMLWHGPSRCFLFNKKLLDLVGWFDERMTGFTWEDLDYIRRMRCASVPHIYGADSNIHRFAESLKGEVARDNHPHNNESFFKEKYDNNSQTVFEGTPKFSTPDFYPGRPRHGSS